MLVPLGIERLLARKRSIAVVAFEDVGWRVEVLVESLSGNGPSQYEQGLFVMAADKSPISPRPITRELPPAIAIAVRGPELLLL